MRRMFRPALVLVTLACLASVAYGRSGSGPVARIACAGAQTGTCSEAGTITMQGNSTGSQSTDVVPSTSTTGTEYASPFSPDELTYFDSNWETIVGAYPKLGVIKNTFVKRVLTCAIFAQNVSDLYGAIQKYQGVDSAAGVDTGQVFLTLCLNMVYETQRASGSHAADEAAAARCGMAVVSIPIQVKRTRGTYSAVEVARPAKAGRTPLAVSCRTKGLGIQITMRPRARGRTLHQLIGAHMSIGYSNPTSTPVRIKTTFGFSR